jgi:hypothetical protein
MKYMVANVVHGLGPLIRLGELVQETNKVAGERGREAYDLIVPKTTEKQAELLEQRFGQDFGIWTDPVYGDISGKIMFKGDDFREFMKFYAQNYQGVQNLINGHFKGKFKVRSSEGIEKEVDSAECTELSRNPLIKLPFSRGVSYDFGKKGQMLQTMKGRVPGYEQIGDYLKILEEVEASRQIQFVQDPATSEPIDLAGIIRTPLHGIKREVNNEPMERGIYVSVTGIPGLAQKISDASKKLGLRVYANESPQDFPGCTRAGIETITNPAIEAVFCRLGWGAVNEAVLAGKPLITIPASEKEDPEIILNQDLMVNSLKIGALMDGRPTSEVLEDAKERAGNMKSLVQRLQTAYGTEEGPKYAGKVLNELNF